MAGILILSLMSSTALKCDNNEIFSWHWFILDGIDLLQSLLITFSSVYLIRHLKSKLAKPHRDNEQEGVSQR